MSASGTQMAVKPTAKEKENQWPFAIVLMVCAALGFVLTRLRDGWAEDVAWFAISICLGALVMLFRQMRS